MRLWHFCDAGKNDSPSNPIRSQTPRRTYDNFFPQVVPPGRTFRSSMLLRLNLLAYCSTDEIQISYNNKYLNVLFSVFTFCIHCSIIVFTNNHELSRALKLRSQGLPSPWPAVLSLKYLNARTSWEIFFEISLTPKQILVFTTILQSLVGWTKLLSTRIRMMQFMSVIRRRPPFCQIVFGTLNHATCDVYSPKAVKKLIQRKYYGYWFLQCV